MSFSLFPGVPQSLTAQDTSPTLSTFKCEDDGIFADPEQCDMYWICEQGKATRNYCDDGLVFDHFKGLAGHVDPCDSPFVVDCTDRPYLRTYSSLLTFCNRVFLNF